MAKSSSENEPCCSKDCKKNNDSLNSKIKDLTEKIKDGLGYNAVPPPAADLYLSPKKDLSWTGLPEFVDDTVTDYSRPTPTVESTSEEGQNKNSSTSEGVASPITPKPFVKFVKPKDCQSESKPNEKETAKKPPVKYAKIRIIKTIHVDFDELTAMASKHSTSEPVLHDMTPATISSGLVSNPPSSTLFVPPLRTDWDLLFQPLFNELLTPPPSVDHPALEVITPIAEVVALEPAASTGSPSTTAVDQDAPLHKGFVDQDNSSHVYKLKKALYGLKQAPRAWYDMLSRFLIFQHFSKGAVDPTLFTRKVGNDLLLVQIYVDDIIFASTNTAMCNEFANSMTTKFKMSMMGHMSFFLGLQFSQSLRGIFINQSKYASKIVKKYGMLSSDSVDTPLVEKSKLDEDLQGNPVDATLYRGMIGSLMYLTSSRPDLTYALYFCAQYQAKPTEKHLNAVKRIFRYLKGSAQFLYDKLVSWSSKKQKCTAISSTEVDYIALSGCCAQILWMRSQLTDYGFQFNKIPLYCNNKSETTICCNSVQHSKSKHIDKDSILQAGNPVKEILLKLNLPDHRILKDGGKVKEFQRSFHHSDTEPLSRSDEVLMLKNFKKDASLKLSSYQIKKGMSMLSKSHEFIRWQSLQDGKKRLCFVDDLKVLKITYSHTSQDKGTSSSLKSMITMQRCKTKDQLLHNKDSRSSQEDLKINDQDHKEISL
nr:uncharacterized mitochondrial protein AtMg00810-like [Tanacetum cinerariifolium]